MFTSWGVETAKIYSREDLQHALDALEDEAAYGMVLRAKGVVNGGVQGWLHFDYVPGQSEIRSGRAEVTGRLCVIGAQLKEDALKELWSK